MRITLRAPRRAAPHRAALHRAAPRPRHAAPHRAAPHRAAPHRATPLCSPRPAGTAKQCVFMPSPPVADPQGTGRPEDRRTLAGHADNNAPSPDFRLLWSCGVGAYSQVGKNTRTGKMSADR